MGKIIFTILVIFLSKSVKSQEDQALIGRGNELYKKQQFEKAAEEYTKASDINAKNSTAGYNLGNALYKSKKTEAAEKAYAAAAKNAKAAAPKSKALYNKGVSLTRQNKLVESIQAYKETLRLNPVDEQARENLQKALNELKKQPPQQQPKQDKKKQNNQQNKKQPEPQNNSKLNKKQVEQMLNALRQDEKKLQQNIQKKNSTGSSNGKDW
ncbi:MAG: Tetratricopeptide 2 repeat-containing protein [Segetibacter sp.]|jgi:Ca-activated chloride channel family protein|nr:Tetratricopeptide 2 repeat-containing protein [Segetibacter sp.]